MHLQQGFHTRMHMHSQQPGTVNRASWPIKSYTQGWEKDTRKIQNQLRKIIKEFPDNYFPISI